MSTHTPNHRRSLIICRDCADITSSATPYRNATNGPICRNCAEWDGTNRAINHHLLALDAIRDDATRITEPR